MHLVDHGKNYFLITCEGAQELRLLAHRAGLTIAVRDILADGRVRHSAGLQTLETVASCRSYTEYEACGGNEFCGLYLVRHLGWMPPAREIPRLAAVLTPGWPRRQQPPSWRVGLSLTHLRGQDLPPYAKHLIHIAQEKWKTKNPVGLS